MMTCRRDFEELKIELSELEEAMGYTFEDRGFLRRAVTHRSFANEYAGVTQDNQRLEFLGDAVLGVVIAEALFKADEAAPEGVLSSRLSELVCEAALVDRANALRLGDYLLLGRGEELTGGRQKEGLLADAYEAVLGAVYLDGRFEAVRQMVLEHFQDAIAEVMAGRQRRQKEAPGDFKSLLQRQVQRRRPVRPEYRIVSTSGPPHERVFVAQVLVEGREVGRGEGRSKKEAEQEAASEAITGLDEEAGPLFQLLDESTSSISDRDEQ